MTATMWSREGWSQSHTNFLESPVKWDCHRTDNHVLYQDHWIDCGVLVDRHRLVILDVRETNSIVHGGAAVTLDEVEMNESDATSTK